MMSFFLGFEQKLVPSPMTANIRSLTEQKANTPYLVQILILT